MATRKKQNLPINPLIRVGKLQTNWDERKKRQNKYPIVPDKKKQNNFI
jgi:hypothetical protein